MGHQFISMIDVYQGCHQILLAKTYQDNVSFVTTKGTFHYLVMSFGLKNARATYQMLMDNIFFEKFWCNVEVYIDDILVKTL